MEKTLNSYPYYDWDASRAHNENITCVVGARGIGRAYGELLYENAKLRKLVRDMWCNGFTDDTPFDVEERVFIQMEELGISTKLR